MLLKCRAVAERACLDTEEFDLKIFRSTYATHMLRSCFDVRTVQHWMGHKSLETTMRYLAPAINVQDQVDLVVLPGISRSKAPQKSTARQATLPGIRSQRPA